MYPRDSGIKVTYVGTNLGAPEGNREGAEDLRKGPDRVTKKNMYKNYTEYEQPSGGNNGKDQPVEHYPPSHWKYLG